MNSNGDRNEREIARKFPSRHKGTVVTNIDPLGMGRLLVTVPDVLGADPCIWAESATPLASKGAGVYMVPSIGAGVWVTFLDEDPNHATYDGCWRGDKTDMPAIVNTAPPGTPPIVMGTIAQNTIVISDAPMGMMPTGGIMLKSGLSTIIIAPDGIKITAPKIEIMGMTDINKSALTVTL